MNELIEKILQTDVLVLGGGAAAMRAAIEASRQSARVSLVSITKPGRANNSAISYGGLSGSSPDDYPDDSPQQHYEDTIRGGQGLNRPFLVRLLTDRIWNEIKELEILGVQFVKDESGGYARVARGGHRKPRRLSTSNNSGISFMKPLVSSLDSSGVETIHGLKAISLLHSNQRVCGALFIDKNGQFKVAEAKAVVLATGGGGALYANTTNVPSAVGEGYALALRAGVPLQDMEFVQYVVSYTRGQSIPKQMPPVELLLLKGGILWSATGECLIEGSPDKIFLTRDFVSKTIAGSIAEHPEKPYALLDLNRLSPQDLNYVSGVRSAKIAPLSHFFMGGVRVNQELNLPISGLYAAGEVMGGVHGANRLGGNALAEAFVFGSIIGCLAGQYANKCGNNFLFNMHLATQGCKEVLAPFKNTVIGANQDHMDRHLQKIMGQCAGILRNGRQLNRGLAELKTLREDLFLNGHSNHEKRWWTLTFENKLTVAEMILKSALKREESRGAHYRDDFPHLNDENFLANIVIRSINEQMEFTMESVIS